jgi:hypothetical protein
MLADAGLRQYESVLPVSAMSRRSSCRPEQSGCGVGIGRDPPSRWSRPSTLRWTRDPLGSAASMLVHINVGIFRDMAITAKIINNLMMMLIL